MKRRDVLKGLTLLPVAYGVMRAETLSLNTSPMVLESIKTPEKRDLFKELNIRTFINARGTITAMSGSLMHDYVLDAIKSTSDKFCMIDELQDKVGEKIAAMTHSEAAMVTSGAFSALTLGMAGILTGMDLNKVKSLPNLKNAGMKSEVLIQKTHKIDYNHALLNCGIKLKYVETVSDVHDAVNEKTASMHFLGSALNRGKIKDKEWLELAKQYKLPATIDIAANVPPVSNIWKYNDMGFDFVALSGGKAIRGPQSAGLLMGKKHIIDAARLNAPPRGFNIGRGMKVNKEEIFGMYVALEEYLKRDHEKDWKEWEGRVRHIQSIIEPLRGVKTESYVPPIADHSPTLKISWDFDKFSVSGRVLLELLREGNPSIEAYGGEGESILISPWMMKPGQEEIVANRVKEELENAAI